jgi:DNA-binding response OmpR family regulator
MSGSPPSSSPDDGRRLILIVDDEPSVRAMVHASIRVKAERYRALEVGNATDALVQAREQQPDLVLLDVALPDHDGFWVCRELKSDARTSNMQVIMLTAMGLPSDRDRAIAAGADGYIVKPFSPRALLEELDRRLT